MTKIGRPAIEADLEILANMARNWVNGRCESSTRSLAIKQKGRLLPAKFTQQSLDAADQIKGTVRDKIERGYESSLKRIQVKFNSLKKTGDAQRIGVYLELQVMRYRYRRRAGVYRTVRGDLNLDQGSPDSAALKQLAEMISMTEDCVVRLSQEGYLLHQDWFHIERDNSPPVII